MERQTLDQYLEGMVRCKMCKPAHDPANAYPGAISSICTCVCHFDEEGKLKDMNNL